MRLTLWRAAIPEAVIKTTTEVCVHVFAFSIFWRSRSSKYVRAPIFSRASSNIFKPSSGRSQLTWFSYLCIFTAASCIADDLRFSFLFLQAILTVYLLATARLLVLQCRHVMFWIVLTRMSGLKCCCDSAVAFFFPLIQFLSGWTESSRESRPLHWEACCICSHGNFTEVPACVSTCISSVFIWEILVILCLRVLLLILLCCGFEITSSMFGVSAKVMWSCLRFMFNRTRWHTLLPAPFFIPHRVTCVVQSWQYLKDADQRCNSFSLLLLHNSHNFSFPLLKRPFFRPYCWWSPFTEMPLYISQKWN